MKLEEIRDYLTEYLRSVYIKPVEFGKGFRDNVFIGRSYGRNNASICWPNKPIRTIVEGIRNQDNRISEKTIRVLFENAAVALVEENLASEDGDPEADANVVSLIEELSPESVDEKARAIHDALATSVNDYLVLVPIHGIKIDIAEFAIAGGVLYPKESRQISDYLSPTSFPDVVKDDIQAVYSNCSAIFACTQAGDEQTSVQFARERAKEAIHLLRFYLTPDSLSAQGDHLQMRLVGEPESDGPFAFTSRNIDNVDKMASHWSQELGPFRKYQLGTEQIDFMQRHHYEILHQAILDSTRKKGEIESRISRAIKWFSFAVAAHEIDQKFVGYAVALESLLTDSAKPDPAQSWGGITQKLAER
jgi:hypothetical protein